MGQWANPRRPRRHARPGAAEPTPQARRRPAHLCSRKGRPHSPPGSPCPQTGTWALSAHGCPPLGAVEEAGQQALVGSAVGATLLARRIRSRHHHRAGWLGRLVSLQSCSQPAGSGAAPPAYPASRTSKSLGARSRPSPPPRRWLQGAGAHAQRNQHPHLMFKTGIASC